MPQPLRRNSWTVYIVQCRDGSLYTGITTNLARRLDQHNGVECGGARYTRPRRPVVLVYRERAKGHAAAARREAAIKKLSRIQKESLIARRRSVLREALRQSACRRTNARLSISRTEGS